MSDEFELIDVSPEHTWNSQRKEEFVRLQHIIKRIEKKQIDITSTDPKDIYDVAQCCRVFEPKGEEMFLALSQYRIGYDESNSKIYYHTEISKKPYHGISKIIALCKDHDVSTRITKKEPEQADNMLGFLPADADDNAAFDLEEYGFFSKNNCYYTLVKSGSGFEPQAFTNFTMKVLFHMNNGESPRRVLEFVNYKKRKKVIDVETTALTGVGKFMELVEGLGNFLFYGNAGQLNAIKRKVFDEEGNCTQLSNLGWMDDEGLWVWGNGVFMDNKFFEADKEGFIMNGDDSYYIASANKSIPNRKFAFANHLKFSYKAQEAVTFNKWCRHYYTIYGEIGIPVMLHTMSCLFSDIIFETMNGFPILFIYGEGGSGKSSGIKSAQRLLGSPQDPLKLSGSNTDKSKIRTFAQFVNSMIFLDEYVNNEIIDELLKGLFDRYGYKRATMDRSYNTETVPIQSGVAVAGNYIPYNEPLITRLLFLTHNKNVYSEKEKKMLAWFDDWSSKGSCNVTHSLLALRKYAEDNYKNMHRKNVELIMGRKESRDSVSRMIDSYAVQLTMYDMITLNGMQMPFTREVLENYLMQCLKAQNELRNNDNDYAKFWEVCGSLLSTKQHGSEKGIMEYNYHYKVVGDELHVLTGLLWPLWIQEYYKIYKKGAVGKTTMLSKLENKSRGWILNFKSGRVGNNNSSGAKFSLKLLPSDFVDLVHSAERVYNGREKHTEVPTFPTEGENQINFPESLPF